MRHLREGRSQREGSVHRASVLHLPIVCRVDTAPHRARYRDGAVSHSPGDTAAAGMNGEKATWRDVVVVWGLVLAMVTGLLVVLIATGVV